MMSSVARKPSQATDDIINYNKKKNNYRNELKERAATPVVDAAAAVAGAAPRAGSLKSSETLIRTFLKRKGVAEVDKGVKFGHKTLSFAYDDMISDLTKNVKKTNTNLSQQQHTKLLKELKRTGMPVGYIRSENLRKQYRDLETGTSPQIPQTPPPAYQTPPTGIVPQQQPSTSFSFPTPIRSKRGKPREYMM